MTTITLDGLEFDLEDFLGTGHAEILAATTGASGQSYPEEARWPNRIMRAFLNQQSVGFAPTVVAVTDASKTLALSDGNTIQACDRATAQTITIPPNASVAFDVGTVIIFEQHGAGQVTLDGDTGVTVNGASGGSVAIDAQYLGCYLRKTATDTWIVIGGLA